LSLAPIVQLDDFQNFDVVDDTMMNDENNIFSSRDDILNMSRDEIFGRAGDGYSRDFIILVE
jgi:hypothetical protein